MYIYFMNMSVFFFLLFCLFAFPSFTKCSAPHWLPHDPDVAEQKTKLRGKILSSPTLFLQKPKYLGAFRWFHTEIKRIEFLAADSQSILAWNTRKAFHQPWLSIKRCLTEWWVRWEIQSLPESGRPGSGTVYHIQDKADHPQVHQCGDS